MTNLLLMTVSVMILYISNRFSYLIAKSSSFDYLNAREKRFGAIDGLRGYLAIGVFIHHSIITWYWKSTGLWERPPQDYIHNFGKVGVAVFFMITGFLFIQKLINDKSNTDWFVLYISRVFRIYPLYIFALMLITLISFIQTNFIIDTSLFELFKGYVKWMLFSGANINGFKDTELIIAEVYWTLKYEWLFYLSLPLLALFIRANPFYLIILLFVLVLLQLNNISLFSLNLKYLYLFLIGGITAIISSKYISKLKAINTKSWSFISLIALFLSLNSSNLLDLKQIVFISVFFIPIALGNNMFGLFSQRASIVLGELSYSIYLLHGVVLYTVFTLFLSTDSINISLENHLVLLPFVVCIVIFISALTFFFIERPSIRIGKKMGLNHKTKSPLLGGRL